MTISQFAEKIRTAFPKLNFGEINSSNIEIKSRSEGGRVSEIQIGSQTISGTDLRSALDLYSARIKISVNRKKLL